MPDKNGYASRVRTCEWHPGDEGYPDHRRHPENKGELGTSDEKRVPTYSVFCHFKRDFDVTLSAQVVYLGGLYLSDDVHQVGAVTQITVMEVKVSRT